MDIPRGGSSCPLFPSGTVGFCGGRKTGRSGENRRSKDENQQQTQPTCNTRHGKWTQATWVGGERSHHCAIPVDWYFVFQTEYHRKVVKGILSQKLIPVSLYKNLYFSFRFPGKCRCLPAYVLAVLLPSLRDIKNRSKLQHHNLPRLEVLGFTQPFSCQVKV